MKSSNSTSARGRMMKGVGVIAAASLVSGLLSVSAAAAETGATTPAKPVTTAPAIQPRPVTQMTRELWRKAMKQVPLPKKGCFTAEYPKTEWKEVPCTKAPERPYPPAGGPRPSIVGNGTDWSAQVTSGYIESADGSFANVTGVTSETGNGGASDNFSLQLNTDFFSSSACSGAAVPANCSGWEQFVYSNSGYAFIQYWLINWATTCPAGWNTYGSDCWRNASSAATVPAQPLSNLANLSVTGTVGASSDSISFSTGSHVYSAPGDNSVDAASGWRAAEYNVFGDCCGSQANFNSGSTIVVRTSVDNMTLNAPSCQLEGFTGETNNLTLSGTPSIIPVLHEPRIEFTESNPAGTPETCATSIGDTHLATFSGLFYDFQASGDFVLAQAGSDFMVQTRQVSGAPAWPNASVNKAVAAKMGNTRIAVCTGPTRFFVNGTLKDLGDGALLSLPGGVSVYRGGDTYMISRKNGDIVRAQINSYPSMTWMDVSVGVRRSPSTRVRGLVANPNGNIGALAMRNGTVLNEPVSFTDLYHRYADSWRVQSKESLLSPCGDQGIERGIPLRAFYAKDLAPQQFREARAMCTAAGVRDATALEACTLDAAVLPNKAATRVYTRALPTLHAVLRPDMRLERLNLKANIRPQ